MCGIFGGVGLSEESVMGCLSQMHRGDDGTTIRTYGSVILGARRNMVKEAGVEQTLGAESDQPYESADQRTALIFNGELFNYELFRDELLAGGTKFRSVGDSETWLRLYERDGLSMFDDDRIDSIFALGIVDLDANRLTIARDWPGRAPLFYFHDAATRRFVFTSELKVLRTLDWVPIEQVIDAQPGSQISLDLDSFEVQKTRFHTPQPKHTDSPLMKVGEDLHELLNTSGRHRTMGDTPICTMLSGGIDSVLATYYVYSNIDFKARDFAPTSYVMSVDGFVSEDVRRARRAAAHFSEIDLTLKEVTCNPADLVGSIPQILEMFENRDIKALSVYPLPIYYYLAPAMRADGFNVTVGGHGVDEMLGAYDSWKELKSSHKVQVKTRSRVTMMNAVYKNMMRRSATILMNRGPVEARAPFLARYVIDYMLGISPEWLSISPSNVELFLGLVDANAGASEAWQDQLTEIHTYLVAYLDNGGAHPDGYPEHYRSEIEKLFWKLPLITAGAIAGQRGWLPFEVLLNSKLRGQHGTGISSLEPDIIKAYQAYGNTDGEIFQNIVNELFNMKAPAPDPVRLVS